MDQDAYVQECTVDEPALDLSTGGPPPGQYIGANRRLRADAASLVDIEKAQMRGLIGLELSCQGLDWHGSPPP